MIRVTHTHTQTIIRNYCTLTQSSHDWIKVVRWTLINGYLFIWTSHPCLFVKSSSPWKPKKASGYVNWILKVLSLNYIYTDLHPPIFIQGIFFNLWKALICKKPHIDLLLFSLAVAALCTLSENGMRASDRVCPQIVTCWCERVTEVRDRSKKKLSEQHGFVVLDVCLCAILRYKNEEK